MRSAITLAGTSVSVPLQRCTTPSPSAFLPANCRTMNKCMHASSQSFFLFLSMLPFWWKHGSSLRQNAQHLPVSFTCTRTDVFATFSFYSFIRLFILQHGASSVSVAAACVNRLTQNSSSVCSGLAVINQTAFPRHHCCCSPEPFLLRCMLYVERKPFHLVSRCERD